MWKTCGKIFLNEKFVDNFYVFVITNNYNLNKRKPIITMFFNNSHYQHNKNYLFVEN